MKTVQTESPPTPEPKFPATIWNGAGVFAGWIVGDRIEVLRWVMRGTPPTREIIPLPIPVSEVLSVDLTYPAITDRRGALLCWNRGIEKWEKVGSLAEST